MMTRNPSQEAFGVIGVQNRCIIIMCQRKFRNVLKKGNLAAIPLILIPEYGQSNATQTI